MATTSIKKPLKSKRGANSFVSFGVFKNLVENLPDICFDIQRDKLDNKECKTLDECALWYYEEFYKNPGVRDKYPFKLRACPQKIKEKFFKIQDAHTDSDSDPVSHPGPEIKQQTSDGVKVKVVGMGTFIFPVTFLTFEKYVSKKKVLKEVKTKEEHEALLANEKMYRKHLKKFYYTFYIFPHKRRQSNYFKDVPNVLMTHMLEYGRPFDELAAKFMSDQDAKKSQKKTSSIVSFEVFEKLLANLYDIVWQLKLNDEQYVSMGFEDCARAYYLAFYLTPEIRNKYPIILRPCQATLREHLLAIPDKEAADLLRQSQPQLVTSTPELESPKIRSLELTTETAEDVILDLGKSGKYKFPVDIDIFKRHINYDEIIQPILQKSVKDVSNLSSLTADPHNACCQSVFRRYYRSFYVFPNTRCLYSHKFSNVSPELLERLLRVAEPLNEMAKQTMGIGGATSADKLLQTPTKPKQLNTQVGHPDDTSEPNGLLKTPEKTREAPTISHSPVGFKLFKKYIQNLDEIAEKMQNCSEYKNLSHEKCEREFFRKFYSSPEIRNKFNIKLKPCPAKVRNKLLSLPARSAIEESSSKVAPSIKDDHNKSLTDSTTITLQDVTYEYPVTFNCFQQFVNRKELVQQLVKCQEESKENGSPNLTDQQLMRRFYYSFYTNENVRQLYNYNFNSAEPDLREKLLEFAKPIRPLQIEELNLDDKSPPSEREPKDIVPSSEHSIKNLFEGLSQESLEPSYETDVTVDCGKSGKFQYPVSFDTFRLCINYPEIIRPILMQVIQDKIRVEKLLAHPWNPHCERTFRRYYRSFYVLPEVRQQYAYRFDCSDPKVLKKLLDYAEPLDENAKKTMQVAKTQGPQLKVKENVEKQREDVEKLDVAMPAPESKGEEGDASNISASDYQERVPMNIEILEIQIIQPQASNAIVAASSKETEKPKENFAYPVSFKVFKRYIKNLDDIVQQMQQFDEYKNKSEDECAEEYYQGFYKETEMRERFICKFRPCPGRIRDKLLTYMPMQTENCPQQLECHMDISSKAVIDNREQCGSINMEDKGAVIEEPGCVEGEKISITHESEMHVDDDVGDGIGEALCVGVHQICNIETNEKAHNEDVAKVIEEPICVEAQSKRLPKEYVDAKMKPVVVEAKKISITDDKEIKPPETTKNNQESASNPVTFALFKRYVTNLSEIVDQMLLCDEYKGKTAKECAQDYYKGFYTVPEIRQKFICKLKPCPAKIKDMLLAYPDPSDQGGKSSNEEVCEIDCIPGKPRVQCTKEQVSQVDSASEKCRPESIEKSQPIVITMDGVTYEYPVSLKAFQQFINYDEIKLQLKDVNKKNPQLTEHQLMRRFYHSFYLSERTRKLCNYNFNVAPADMQEKLMAFAIPRRSDDKTNNIPNESDKRSDINDIGPIQDFGKYGRFQFPVSFETFKQCINFNEIIRSVLMQIIKDKKEVETIIADPHNPRYEKCFRQYYGSFYVFRDVRNRHPYRFETADALLLNKLEEYAVPLDEKAQKTMANRPLRQLPGSKGNEEAWIPNSNADGTLIPLQGIIYKFPVPFLTFKRYVNYEELKLELVKDGTPKHTSPEKLAEIASDEQNCLRLLRRYYHSFYTSERIRARFNYNFDAAPSDLRQHLLDFAVSVFKSDKNTQSVPEEVPTSSEARTETVAESQGSVEPPISFNVFKYFVLLDDVVDGMRKEPEYSHLSDDECKQIYYKAFYSCPSIRLKYPFKLRLCPVELKETLLMIPKYTPLNDENKAGNQTNTQNVDELHLARKAQLDATPRVRVVNYTPNNLHAYIARRIACPEKQQLLERHILDCIKAMPGTHNSTCDVQESHQSRPGSEDKSTDSDAASKEVRKSSQADASKSTEVEKVSLTSTEQNIAIKATAIPKETHVDLTRKPDSSSNARTSPVKAYSTASAQSTLEPQNKQGRIEVTSSAEKIKTTSDKNSEASTKTQPQSDQHIRLEKAKEIFFAECSQNHNMKYLICTSMGLKKAIWRILFQLSLEEFSRYTSIHDGEQLYKCEEALKLCHQHVVDQGNWPPNLYVRFSKLRQLLHNKGVQLEKMDLGQLSPKMLHWRDLILQTNFDAIVELQYTDRTGKKLKDLKDHFQELEMVYNACWRHDEWIYGVPQIMYLNEVSLEELLATEEIVLKPLCPRLTTSPTETISIACSSDPTPEQTSCPSTQLNTSNFVDVADVCPPSQVPVTEIDPLTPMEMAAVKQEPIMFLNNLRGICNTDECQWESITSNDQIIDLDSSQEDGPSLSCFAIPKPREVVPSLRKDTIDSLLIDEEDSQDEVKVMSQSSKNQSSGDIEPKIEEVEVILLTEEIEDTPPQEVPEPSSVIQQQMDTEIPAPQQTASRKKKLPSSNEVSSKRPRLMTEKVPQLRHDFRPLPLHAVVRIEVGLLSGQVSQENTLPPPSEPVITSQPAIAASQPAITPSQDFAAGNTLLESSQLQTLLDAPNVTRRKVNEKQVNTVCGKIKAWEPNPDSISSLRSKVIYRNLERFRFFSSLTVQQIGKYQIEGHLVGSTYQDAVLKIGDKLSNIRGPLLEIIFPRQPPRFLQDLRTVLFDLENFEFNCRRHVYKDPAEDLRVRVVALLMCVAPQFGQFRVQFDNASRVWATCSKLGRWDVDAVERRAGCNVAEIIKPNILERMRELKELMC